MSQLTPLDAEPAAERIRSILPDGESRAPAPPSRVEYPSSDGKPMAENTLQFDVMVYAASALRAYFRGRRADVFASGDLLFYYEEGNPRASVAPDVFVVFGVEDRARMRYLVWEEGKGPDFVLEVASPSTWSRDLERKPGVYARMGVGELFLFDPWEGRYLRPALRGHRLMEGEYVRLPEVVLPEGGRVVHSEVLGLEVRAQGRELSFRDPETGERLLGYEEEHAARLGEAEARQAAESRAEVAESKAEAAESRAEAAEARIAELEALHQVPHR